MGMRLKSFLVSIGLFAWAAFGASCSSGPGRPPDGSVRDGTTYDLALDLPPGCPPGQPNDKGVGATCTRGGGECKSSGLVCACDTILGLTLNGVPCICTLAGLNQHPGNPSPCAAATPSCGSNATCCDYMSTAYYCSPNICLPGGSCINFTPADSGT
jgi:hypothetical protein